MTGPLVNSSDAPRRHTWVTALVLGVAGLFYAFAVWNAIANMVALGQAGEGLTGLGWGTGLFGVVFPAIVFVFAYLIGRRRGAGGLGLILLAGLGLVAVFWLSLVGYSILNLSDLVNVSQTS